MARAHAGYGRKWRKANPERARTYNATRRGKPTTRKRGFAEWKPTRKSVDLLKQVGVRAR